VPYSQFLPCRTHAEHVGRTLSQPFFCFRHDEQACKAFGMESVLSIMLTLGMEVDAQQSQWSTDHGRLTAWSERRKSRPIGNKLITFWDSVM
jgi:hypothetical protein